MSRTNAWWNNRSVAKMSRSHQSPMAGPGSPRGRRLRLDELESRIAPASLTYEWASQHSLIGGANLTLNVSSDGSKLQIVDNDTAIVAS